jgi:hypothetical protein
VITAVMPRRRPCTLPITLCFEGAAADRDEVLRVGVIVSDNCIQSPDTAAWQGLPQRPDRVNPQAMAIRSMITSIVLVIFSERGSKERCCVRARPFTGKHPWAEARVRSASPASVLVMSHHVRAARMIAGCRAWGGQPGQALSVFFGCSACDVARCATPPKCYTIFLPVLITCDGQA